MPISRHEIHGALRRLTDKASLAQLGKQLSPVLPKTRPLPPELPAHREWDAAARDARIAALRAMGFDLPHLFGAAPAIDPANFQGNIEHFVGMTQIPTGIMGPLRVNGPHAHGDFFVPLATSEGTLVASYHRGARLASQAGGITSLATVQHVQRAPAFIFDRIAEAARFASWAAESFDRFAAVAEAQTRHGKLVDVLAHIEGNHVYLIFTYSTGEAAGQNMVTLCTAALCEEILETTPVQPTSWFVEANMSGDKKSTVLGFLLTRGHHVVAEVLLPRAIVEHSLRTTPERMAEYWRVSFVGGVESGSIGVSGHIANGLTALFLACGQDVACVSEANVGITRMEQMDGDLYCSVTLPNLIVGSLGGGTRLPTQQECLKLVGCSATDPIEGSAAKFAEICAAVVLAGEISIVGAICAHEFAAAHSKFGRPAQT